MTHQIDRRLMLPIVLYVTTPSSGNGMSSQDPNTYAGKVLRLNDDGTVPPDNPFVGRAGHRPEVYTFGHRNSLGLPSIR